jgi:parallel beta-helix repeat protein
LKRVVSGMMVTLLLIGMLTLANIKQVEAENDLVLEMSVSKTVVIIGETINITLTLKNIGSSTITLMFSSSQAFDVYLCIRGLPILAWSYGKAFAQYVWELTLQPGETFSRTLRWNFYRYDQQSGNYTPPDPGHYGLMGVCVGHTLAGWICSDLLPTWLVPMGITVPYDYPTIQEAINHANEGDTILVRTGTYNENVVVNKTVSLIGEDKDSTVLNGTTIEPIMIVEANDVKISGFTFEGWATQDIAINATTGVIIVENKIVFNALGIDVESSVNTTIENNVIDGFGLDNIGIMLAYSSECSIVNNTITNAVYDGIRLWFSSSNLIHQNLIKDNDYGMFFHEANLNTISENTISESGGPGIYIESSSSNKIIHNNFMDNYYQAVIYDNSVNTWDNGCEGNYWSDYNGTDSNGDRIGDTPYVIDADNTDNYPLMNPFWNPADINHDFEIDVRDIYTVARSYGTSSTVPNPEGREWNPHCDINEDGAVDLKDYYIVCKNYGKRYP